MPDFVIIGAMKCATSTLHDQLARVEGVSMSEPKEPNFFSDEEAWDKGLGWYESLFDSMPNGDLIGESSTHYTKLPTYPDCVQRITTHLPHAKLIYVMRDPVERIVSQYIHEWSQRVIEKNCPIDVAIMKHPMLVDYSRYASQLAPYLSFYGHGRILPVFFERLMAQPQQEFERVGRFLGIVSPMRWDMCEAKNVSSVRQRRGPVINTLLSVPIMQRLRRALLPEAVRAQVRSRWTMRERPQLSPDSLSVLHKQLDPEMQQLGRMLGLELDCASFKSTVVPGPAPEWSTGGTA